MHASHWFQALLCQCLFLYARTSPYCSFRTRPCSFCCFSGRISSTRLFLQRWRCPRERLCPRRVYFQSSLESRISQCVDWLAWEPLGIRPLWLACLHRICPAIFWRWIHRLRYCFWLFWRIPSTISRCRRCGQYLFWWSEKNFKTSLL